MVFTHDIVLDITFNEIKNINLKQYVKNSHILHVLLTESGQCYKADNNIMTCYFKMLTPDGRHIFTGAIIEDDGSITVHIPESACLKSGIGKAELVLTKSEDESYIFASMNFHINIVSSVYTNDAIIASDDFDALNKALIDINKNYEYVMEHAQASAIKAESYAHGGTNTREGEDADNAMHYKEKAREYAESADKAETSVLQAKTLVDEVEQNVYTAQADAMSSMDMARIYAEEAAASADMSKSYAIGQSGARENDDMDNAKFYSEKAQEYANTWKGSLLPKGTILFSQLPTENLMHGYMYNIKETFTTDSRFRDGIGYSYPAGTNVYWAVDDKWDCLSGALTMELTQAEYDALPEAEKKNGTIYYILDADNTIPTASDTEAGLLSPDDKMKLNGIEPGARVNVQADWDIEDSSDDAYIKSKPSSLPASDVHPWAKEAEKPSYTASEVGALPVDGNAVSATKLKTARTINGTAFDGTKNIRTSFSYNLRINYGDNKKIWYIFARIDNSKFGTTTGNAETTLFFCNSANYDALKVSHKDAWAVYIGKRYDNPPVIQPTRLSGNDCSSKFGYYVDEESGYTYIGVETETYHGNCAVTLFSPQYISDACVEFADPGIYNGENFYYKLQEEPVG